MDQGKILETYYDHYKETCTLSKESQSRRNKSFVILCVLEAISLLMTWNKDFICAILNDTIRNRIENDVQIGSNVLQTLVWILIAYVVVRYVQDAMYVERQYRYLSNLEKKIGELLNENIFSREGEEYLKDYPPVLNIIHLFYNMFCPLLFTAINIYHIVLEWDCGVGGLSVIIDTVIFVAIIIITVFFFFEMHTKIRDYILKCKIIAWFDCLIRRVLKEV